jgi:hypothetical protein
MPMIERTRASKVWRGYYDFAVDGGATAAIVLRSDDGPLPAGSVVVSGYLDVLTLFTTGTAATAAISVEAANDIQTATVVSGAPFSTTGRKSITPAGTGATAIKTTASRYPTITFAVGTVTAGKLELVLEFV